MENHLIKGVLLTYIYTLFAIICLRSYCQEKHGVKMPAGFLGGQGMEKAAGSHLMYDIWSIIKCTQCIGTKG